MKATDIQTGVRGGLKGCLNQSRQSVSSVPFTNAFRDDVEDEVTGQKGTEASYADTDGRRPTRADVEHPLTCDEAGELLRAHPKTVKRMARSGRLPGHFRFGRWLFYASELDRWMRAELHSSHRPCR